MPNETDGTATLDAIRCACGESILNRERTVQTFGDARMTCDRCGRGYVVTITPFRGPVEGEAD